MTSQSDELDLSAVRRMLRVAALEATVTYVVRRALEAGYRHVAGHEMPTARDRSAPLPRVLASAAVTGAALAAATVVVDRVALRHPDAAPPVTGR